MSKKERRVIIYVFVGIVLLAAVSFIMSYRLRLSREKKYNLANKYQKELKYSKALRLYKELYDYKDSTDLAKKMKENKKLRKQYKSALSDYENEDYESALNKLEPISDFEDSAEKIKQIKYALGEKYYNEGNYEEAKKLFIELEDYNDDIEWYLAQINVQNIERDKEIIYDKACKLLKNGQYEEALVQFNKILDYGASKKKAKKCKNKIKEERRLELSHTLAAGIEYVLAITKDNKVTSVGEDEFGECSGVSSWKNIVSVDCYGEVSIGLKKNGTVKVAGNLGEEQRKKTLKWKNVIDIAAGEKYVVALKSDGTVVAAGHNGDGQCDFSSWGNEKVVDVDAGWRLTVGLTENGGLVFAGLVSEDLINQYKATESEWRNVIKISVSGGEPDGKHRGAGHVVGLKSDGTAIAIGDNAEGQRNIDGKQWKDLADVVAGDWYTVGLKKNGKVIITGKNYPNGLLHTHYIEEEKIDNWEDIKGIAAGYGMTVVLKNNGRLDIMGFRDGGVTGDDALNEVQNWTNIMIKE